MNPLARIVTIPTQCHQLGKLVKTLHLGFALRLVTQAASIQHVPNFQAPRVKAGVQHKLSCLYKHFMHIVSHHSQVMVCVGGGSYRNLSPRYQLGVNVTSRPFKGDQLGLLCELSEQVVEVMVISCPFLDPQVFETPFHAW